ncbi:MAG: ABC transporter ATP-binding protein [Acidimicrobiales bacterium]|nr:ABC transporter ATP-binding protein [Acidimicrobiales bacterium]
MSDLLTVQGLCAGYDGIAVVHDLDLHVGAGEVVALLGPNGAGKTTTLSTVSGLLPVIRGELDVLGAGPPSTRRPQRTARRGVAHVPEDRAIFHELTVRENLRLGGLQHGRDLDDVLDYFPALEPLLDRRAGLLSGGEQQMLAVGRALASRPRLLMIDEMSLGLAPIVVERLLPVVRRIADEADVGVLLVEQHVHLALEVADRVYVLNRGQVVVSGPAAQVRDDAQVLESSYLGSTVL